ncbi:MAG: DeoR family transcriptional regulator [Oligoflexia bacterium]|nr:DeoR family transcriptional regulator [Oligoflexia bacterium]
MTFFRRHLSIAGHFEPGRLEIWSEGLLPFGQQPDDLKKPHTSRPRNPVIAGVFYRPDLGPRQNEILQVLAAAGTMIPFSTIRASLSTDASERTIRNDLVALREAGLVRLQGQGRGARWGLTTTSERGNE